MTNGLHGTLGKLQFWLNEEIMSVLKHVPYKNTRFLNMQYKVSPIEITVYLIYYASQIIFNM